MNPPEPITVEVLAAELGIKPKQVVSALAEMGEGVESPSSYVPRRVELRFRARFGDQFLAYRDRAAKMQAVLALTEKPITLQPPGHLPVEDGVSAGFIRFDAPRHSPDGMHTTIEFPIVVGPEVAPELTEQLQAGSNPDGPEFTIGHVWLATSALSNEPVEAVILSHTIDASADPDRILGAINWMQEAAEEASELAAGNDFFGGRPFRTKPLLDGLQIDHLEQLVRSECDRFGHEAPGLNHVALAISHKWPEYFEAAFGTDGKAGIEAALSDGLIAGSAADVEVLLRTPADDSRALVTYLHDLLALRAEEAAIVTAHHEMINGLAPDDPIRLERDLHASPEVQADIQAAQDEESLSDREFTFGHLTFLANCERRRWGGSEISLTHLAFALSKLWPVEFALSFGADGRARLENDLRARRFRGTDHDVTGLLLETLGGDNRTDLLSRLAGHTLEVGQPEPRRRPPRMANAFDYAAVATGTEALIPVAPRDDILDRHDEIAEICAQLRRDTPVAVIVTGEAGSGRSSLIAGVAARLAASKNPLPLLRPASDEPDTEAIGVALADAPAGSVVAIDDIDELCNLHVLTGSRSINMSAQRIQIGARISGARLLLTCKASMWTRLQDAMPELSRRAIQIPLVSLPKPTVAFLLRARLDELTSAYAVNADESLLNVAVSPPTATDKVAHPALAFERVDAALARAAELGAGTATTKHHSAIGTNIETRAIDLHTALSDRIKGQEHAVETVARRIAWVRNLPKPRPERPDGVFLFVGPSGVGKTELARELARLEFGGEDRLIRLDMSEYMGRNADGPLSRLVGVGPGWRGSREGQENWLTTRVNRLGRAVILFDEIEKANPAILNLFLQIFDAGRLTDGLGVVGNFTDTVIIMTSNLQEPEERLRPELLGRVDQVVQFRTLSREALWDIARDQLDRVLDQLRGAGWDIEVAPSVVDWLSEAGYSPDYGARHLQRNIESELLGKLVYAPNVPMQVTVEDGALRFTPRLDNAE